MRVCYRTICAYGASLALIAGWWWLADVWKRPSRPLSAGEVAVEAAAAARHTDVAVALPERDELVAALSGNWATALKLLAVWDRAAVELEGTGIAGVRRLPRPRLLDVYGTGYLLLHGSEEERRRFCASSAAVTVTDDRGVQLHLHQSPHRALPQTYAAAAVLLALAGTQGIVALPRGLRDQQRLFPEVDMEAVTCDSDRYHAELLQKDPPDVAIVNAEYSNPAFLGALADQGIPLFTLKVPDNLTSICGQFRRLGQVVDRQPEAEILATFFEGAFIALDNLLLANRDNVALIERPLLLFCYQRQWYLPGGRNLTAQLTKRLGLSPVVNAFSGHDDTWLTPLSLEELVNYNPDHLIIATDLNVTESVREQLSHPPLDALAACRSGRVYTVDIDVQESLVQQLALAYYDLCRTLLP